MALRAEVNALAPIVAEATKPATKEYRRLPYKSRCFFDVHIGQTILGLVVARGQGKRVAVAGRGEHADLLAEAVLRRVDPQYGGGLPALALLHLHACCLFLLAAACEAAAEAAASLLRRRLPLPHGANAVAVGARRACAAALAACGPDTPLPHASRGAQQHSRRHPH